MDKSTGGVWRLRPPRAAARQQRTVEGDPQWPTTLMALGILVFVVLFWTIGQRTFISFNELFRWFALFAFAGNLLPQRWYAKRFAMDRLEWFWFNLLAVGPLLCCSCLALNFLVHGPEEKMLVPEGRAFNLHAYWREQGALPPHLPWPSAFDTDPEQARHALATATANDKVYGLAEGLFGYLVITEETEVLQLLRDRDP